MTSLVACLSIGKGTWSEVIKVINSEDWEKIVLVTNEFGKEKFTSPKPAEMIVIDSSKGLSELRDEIASQLDGKLTGGEIALNISSGTGKEHAAVISAILKSGFGIRLVGIENDSLSVL